MTTVSKQEILARWETLSDTLREALASQESAEALQRILESEHIPEYKRNIISGAIGLVLLGFLHPEELRGEIENAATLPPQTAAAVASAVISRILEPLRQELSRAYAPAGSTPRPATRIVSDMQLSGMPTLVRSTPGAPIGQASAVGTPAPKPAGPMPSPLGAPVATTGTTAPAPAPVMLHRETEFKPIQQTTSSSALKADILGKQPAGTGAVSMFGGKPAASGPAAPIAAKIEFGSASGAIKQPQMPTISRTEANIPRVVHYSDMKTPVSPFGAAATGMSPMPQAPRPPMPPSIPPIPQAPRAPSIPAITPTPQPPRPTLPPMTASPTPSAQSVPQAPTTKPKEVNYTAPAPKPPTPPGAAQRPAPIPQRPITPPPPIQTPPKPPAPPAP